jgi:hypothetical protein
VSLESLAAVVEDFTPKDFSTSIRLPLQTIAIKKFKIRRIIEYPDTEKEGGGREGIGWKAGSFCLSWDFVTEQCMCVFLCSLKMNQAVHYFFFPGFGISRHH